jgi:hypothetical protein
MPQRGIVAPSASGRHAVARKLARRRVAPAVPHVPAGTFPRPAAPGNGIFSPSIGRSGGDRT